MAPANAEDARGGENSVLTFHTTWRHVLPGVALFISIHVQWATSRNVRGDVKGPTVNFAVGLGGGRWWCVRVLAARGAGADAPSIPMRPASSFG